MTANQARETWNWGLWISIVEAVKRRKVVRQNDLSKIKNSRE